MIEGLWVVQFKGIQGEGGGAVVLVNGRVLGGDSGYFYSGTYAYDSGRLTARLKITNFLPAIGNVLGIQGDFELEINAAVADGRAQGAMTLVGRSGAGIVVRMVKKADL